MAISRNTQNPKVATAVAENPELVTPEESQTTPSGVNANEQFYQKVEHAFNNNSAIFGTTVAELLSSPFATYSVNDRVNKIQESLTRVLDKRGNTPTSFEIISYMGDEVGAYYPMLVGVNKTKNERGEVVSVSYGVVIVETDTTIDPEVVPFAGRQLELPRPATAAYNAVVDDAVRKLVLKTVGQNVPLVYSGVSVLPREWDISDNDAVNAKLLDAIGQQVISSELDESVVVQDPNANLGDVLRNGGYQLVATINQETNVTDATGLPIAADVVVATKARQPQHGRNSTELLRNNHIPITSTAAVIDLIRVGVVETYNRGRPTHVPQPKHSYLGNVVLTYVANDRGLTTLATALLGVAAGLILHSEEIYPELFRPKANTPWDLGAVGYELPDPNGQLGKMDITSAEFADGVALRSLVFETVFPDMLLSIDIPNAILGSRALKTVSRTNVADTSNPRDAEVIRNHAIGNIVNTIDKLTQGLFSSQYWVGGNIVSPVPVLVPMGYWLDSTGTKRDLREIGYLAALDHAGKTNDPQFIIEWSNTFNMSSPELGAAKRIDLMKQIVGSSNVVVKDYAQRFMFERTFIDALALAAQATGVAPTFSNLVGDARGRINNNLANYQQYLVESSVANQFASAAFSRNTNGGPSFRGFNDRFYR